jgi:peptidoglycan/xylan/chitin deacetylase (PgdA/CDA1 family)
LLSFCGPVVLSAPVTLVTFMYHDVVTGDPNGSGFPGPGPNHYKLAADRFEAHLDVMQTSGLELALVGGQRAERALQLTFDDGGSSASIDTAPRLERRGWRGHFFVTTDRIGTAGFLGRDEIRALHEAGHVVGSHGCSHRALTGLSDDEVRREWSVSRAVLEDLLSSETTVASVPTGRYSARVGRHAAEAGYRHVFTCEPWLEPRPLESALLYGRFPVYAGTSAGRISALCSLSRPTVWWVGGTWYVRKAAKAALGPVYDPLRRKLLSRLPS